MIKIADILGRTGPNTFLDQVELEQRELRSARVEKREPDFSVENMAPLLADENANTGVAATADFQRIDVNQNSKADIDAAIEKLQARRSQLEITDEHSFLAGTELNRDPNLPVEKELAELITVEDNDGDKHIIVPENTVKDELNPRTDAEPVAQEDATANPLRDPDDVRVEEKDEEVSFNEDLDDSDKELKFD